LIIIIIIIIIIIKCIACNNDLYGSMSCCKSQ